MASLLAGSITSNLKFTAKVPLLMKATSNDDKPTQGYDLQEICRISKSSLPNCQSLVSFLLGRLEKKDPRIKFKVLHVMKYLVINGPSEFRSQLSRNAETVKKTVYFSGDLDPVHGDGLNIKVQQAASELEKMLFDKDNPELDSICKAMMAPESSKRMQGFGHTVTPEIKKETTFMDTLTSVKKSGLEILSMNKANSRVPPNEYEATPSVPQSRYTPVDLEDSDTSQGDRSDKDDENSDSSDEIESEIDSDHYYEQKLVLNITAEGGITRRPSKEMLRDFAKKSSALELPVILHMLDKRLQNPSLNVQLKSLCVVEYLLRSNLANIPREVNEHCLSIHSLAESQDKTIQATANKIVLIVASCLKQDDGLGVSRATVPPSYDDAKELPKVKDIISSETEHKTAKKTDMNSLFSGMNLSTTKKPYANCKSAKVTPSLIDIENTTDTTSQESPTLMLETHKSNPNMSGDNTQAIKEANENTPIPAQVSDAGSINDLDQISRGMSETRTSELNQHSTSQKNSLFFVGRNELNFGETGKQEQQSEVHFSAGILATPSPGNCVNTSLRNSDINLLQEASGRTVLPISETRTFCPSTRQSKSDGNSINNATVRSGGVNSNNVNLLTWQPLNLVENANTRQNTENLLLIDTDQRNSNSPIGQQQNTINGSFQGSSQAIPHAPNSDLLTFGSGPHVPGLPGGLVLPTNNANRRRPFPKDMKSEVTGFGFIQKSAKPDAFSFIKDEMQASKTKPK